MLSRVILFFKNSSILIVWMVIQTIYNHSIKATMLSRKMPMKKVALTFLDTAMICFLILTFNLRAVMPTYSKPQLTHVKQDTTCDERQSHILYLYIATLNLVVEE